MLLDLTHRGEPIRTLLVDDSPGFLDALSRLLLRVPQIIVSATASNGVEALAAVAHNHPDLVVIDVAMPGMNGLEATRQIKHEPHPRALSWSLSQQTQLTLRRRTRLGLMALCPRARAALSSSH